MAITTKPAPGSYTVNEAHAKCPDHLWMLDEESGTVAADKGKAAGKMDMNLDNADMWDTDALGPVVVTNNSGPRRGFSDTGTFPSSSVVFVAYVKSTNVGASSNETPFSAGNDTVSNQNMTFMRGQADEALDSAHYDGTNTRVADSGTDFYGQTWRMIATKAKANGVAASVDGGAWVETTSASSFPSAAGSPPNRYGLGVLADSTPGNEYNGSLLAVMVFHDLYDTADDTWIADLYDDPWQFLNLGGGTSVVSAAYYRMLCAGNA